MHARTAGNRRYSGKLAASQLEMMKGAVPWEAANRVREPAWATLDQLITLAMIKMVNNRPGFL